MLYEVRWERSCCCFVNFGPDCERKPSRDVNLFIGTAGYGHLYPGPKWPNGMVSPGPDTGTGSWPYCAGYQHGDTRVRGFSQIHASGMGAAEFMDVLLQPFAGAGSVEPEWGVMDKRTERAEPGYYACELTNHQVRVELTTSKRVAYHRYTFSGKGPAHVLVDLAWGARMWGGIWSDRIVRACSRVRRRFLPTGRGSRAESDTGLCNEGHRLCGSVFAQADGLAAPAGEAGRRTGQAVCL